MTNFQETTQKLIDNAIGFCAGRSDKESPFWTIEVKQSLNQEQLAVVVSLNGTLHENGIVHILGRD
jgi:hypothetical protein